MRDTKESFRSAWSGSGELFPRLQQFCGDMAAAFPNTATVESDFSVQGWEKDEYRQSLADFSLEGILHAKQFNELLRLCGLPEAGASVRVRGPLPFSFYTCFLYRSQFSQFQNPNLPDICSKLGRVWRIPVRRRPAHVSSFVPACCPCEPQLYLTTQYEEFPHCEAQ
jgi:hypothetical protein